MTKQETKTTGRASRPASTATVPVKRVHKAAFPGVRIAAGPLPNYTPILVKFDSEFLAQIDDFRFKERIGPRVKAIRELIRRGLTVK
jgi:hypothetical protein